MLDIGWQELMLVCVIAVIVVGPKELPKVVRGVTGFVRKARGLAGEFQSNLTDIADANDLLELKNDINAVKDEIAKPLTASADDPTGLGNQLKTLQAEQQQIADEFNQHTGAGGVDFSGSAKKKTKKKSAKKKTAKKAPARKVAKKLAKKAPAKKIAKKTAIKPPSLKQ